MFTAARLIGTRGGGVPGTVRVRGALVPAGVVTGTGKVVSTVEAGVMISAVRLVLLTSVVATLVPLKFTVAPLTKLVPVKVTVVVWPAGMLVGLMLVRVGAPTEVVKLTAGLEVAVVPPPQLLVTVTS